MDDAGLPTASSGCGTLAAGIVIASAVVAVPISIGVWSIALYIFVLPVVVLIGALIGLPIYHAAVRFGAARWWTAAIGGFVTGAIIPALTWLPDPVEKITATLGYGAAGAAAGLIFWVFVTRRP